MIGEGKFAKGLKLPEVSQCIAMMIIISPYVPHHDVDKGVLYEGEEDEEGARGHEHVNRLVGNKIIINNKTSLCGIKNI